MDVIISNVSPDPIYEQIVKQIRTSIISEKLSEGDSLPSIRGLAKDLQVSVITTKRAYEVLEQEGLIISVRGKGFYVTAKNTELFREKKIRLIEEKLSEAISESKSLNISLDELTEIMRLLYED